MQVFGALGVPLTEDMCHQTTGLRMDAVVRYWQVRFPEVDLPVQQTSDAVYDALISLIDTEGEALPGAVHAVHRLASWDLPTALASSSPMRVIETALKRLGLEEVLAVRASAEEVPLGKPHPAVYLLAAHRLDQPPTRCVAIEDSLNGLVAAKAARMRCVVVPCLEDRADPRWHLADARLDQLHDLDATRWVEVAGR